MTGTSISGIAIDSPGSGYTSAPSITFSSGSATATATIQGGGVQAVVIDNPGGNYPANHSPAVSFSGGGGSGADAVALITEGQVTGILIKNPGSGYTTPPSVTIASPSQVTATGVATVNLATGIVSTIRVTDVGGYYNAVPGISFSGGSGSGAAAVAEVFAGRVYRVVVTNGGSGYTSAPTPTFEAPTGTLTQATGRASLGGVAIAVDGDGGPVVFGDIHPLADPVGSGFAKFSVVGSATITGAAGFGGDTTNGQLVRLQALSELTTIAAAAFTDTTIQIPARAIVIAVSVRVTVRPPGTATFDVGVSGATTRYGTAISSNASTVYEGTDDSLRFYAKPTAKASRATPSGDLLVTLMPRFYTPRQGKLGFLQSKTAPFFRRPTTFLGTTPLELPSATSIAMADPTLP